MTAKTSSGLELQSSASGRRSALAWLVHRALQRLQHGTLILRHGMAEHRFGQGAPVVTVRLHRGRAYRRLALGGSVGAGESYMDGDWDCDDLVGLMRLLLANQGALSRLDGGGTVLTGALDGLRHLARGNSRRGSRRNIEAHYDLSNAFFETFLDRRMMYSAAVFEHPQMSLEAASTAKLERLCRKLELKPTDHVLEVGTGWGGLAEYAAGNFGCRVTTITISPAQHATAQVRIARAGLEDRVSVQLCDYRDVCGRYDKVVSVEMVEAVGHDYLPEYCARLGELLAPGGLLALQAITIEDHRYEQAVRSVDFIKKHIFPGSFIPSVSRLVSAMAQRTDTVLVNLEDLGLDYASTLAEWRRRFEARLDDVHALGFDERFCRMWRFYLCYCEAGFHERAISDVQLLFARPGYRGRPWRARLDGAAAPAVQPQP